MMKYQMNKLSPADKLARYKAICHTLPYQKLLFRSFIFNATKRRKFKPSRHIVSNHKKPSFCRAVFTKKGFWIMEEKNKKEEVILTFVKSQQLEDFINALTKIVENGDDYIIRANKSAHIEIVRKHNDWKT